MKCSVEKCAREAVAKGMCLMHYKRVWKHGDPHYEKPKKPLLDRFLKKVRFASKNKCWEWTGALTKGYGVINDGTGQLLRTHRLAWETWKGKIPAGLWVLHKCDNRRCVNPKHLFLGTVADNNLDMLKKGRAFIPAPRYGKRPAHEIAHMQGEKHHGHKLSESKVLDIRRRFKAGETGPSLAKRHGIHPATAWTIATKKTWRHV